ncbi:MAG: alpha/beta hydrolase [Blastocatellia bacterium]|nr:alpha/beta hydrolase [Blastocatellia bacterium]
MKRSLNLLMLLALAGSVMAFNETGSAQEQPFRFAGAPCADPPYLHCPDRECSGATVINQGNVVEMKTRRTYFLDYPCDLKKGERVTFILSLHGGGSYGNWQRHSFPLLDYVDKYRLVVVTPYSPRRAWSPADDEYLQNIVNSVVDRIGKENIKAFWLAGHSQGGQTSNRLLFTDFFRDRVDGWVSLSGGRLGSKRSEVRTQIPRGSGGGPPPGATAPPSTGAAPGATRPGPRLVADASILPDHHFSHIYTSGEHELPTTGLPADSKWAQKLKCGARLRPWQIVDTRAGYVYDTREQPNPNPVWGFKARPGKADMFIYPDCEKGLVVADIIRIDKGHTEGLEPKVTEELIKLMLSAKGGKLQQTH